MSIVIHHNPDCGTSRNVLALIRAGGTEPVVIPYLDTGWTRPQLLALFAAAGGVFCDCDVSDAPLASVFLLFLSASSAVFSSSFFRRRELAAPPLLELVF